MTHLWLVWAVMGTPHQHMNSPLDGLTVLLRSLGIPLLAWIADVSTWLGAPERAGLIAVAAIGAGIAAIISARTRRSGPGIACVMLTLVAVQGGGSAVLVQTAVTIAAPWLVSVVLALVSQSPRSASALGPQFDLPTTSIRLFSALGIYFEIAFAYPRARPRRRRDRAVADSRRTASRWNCRRQARRLPGTDSRWGAPREPE
ncbi:hypothetical protein ACIG47_08610 [Promicromonospora sp. NPDC052451]|uniref:hypothetical protein n=1 Tax=Promicromonospora sp. NPDC052451 TaxID=3364407 RepID=UPI0037C89434